MSSLCIWDFLLVNNFFIKKLMLLIYTNRNIICSSFCNVYAFLNLI